MKRYIVVTNVWGKKLNIFRNLKDFFNEEREYFDTMEEVNEYVNLFEGVYKDSKCDVIKVFEPFEMWGYVVGDTKNLSTIKFGGTGMKYVSDKLKGSQKNISKAVPFSKSDKTYSFNNMNTKMNKLYIKDYLFRGEDEISPDYIWDNGEYEGWLQFRWGDGKNAIDYVEPEKPKKTPDDIVDFAEMEDPWFEQEHDENLEEIENSFLRDEDKERIKILEDRW